MDFAPGYEDFATRYYWTRLLTPLQCCGCLSNHYGSGLACLIWAGFSFYFAVLAFMSKSPFYSHLHEVPLIIFGVANLLFGCITLAGFFIVYLRPLYVRVRVMVYVIAVGATLVLISTLVNFILFVVNRGTFEDWCIENSRNFAQSTIYEESGGNSTLVIQADTDYYNCDRLFANQVKWSLLCVIVMYIIYIHWMLVFAVFAGTSFFLVPPRAAVPPMEPPLAPEPMGPPPPATIVPPTSVVPPTEFSNLPASNKEKDSFYRNLKPTKKKKKQRVDPNLLSILGLKVDETGRVIHLADDDCLPRYTDRRPSYASKTYTSSDDEDIR